MFVRKYEEAPDLVTFSDVMLLPGKTETEPKDINLRSKVTRKIELNAPYVASPMDTVTEEEMGIAIARAGGVGVLHRNCSIEREVMMAKRVKRAESFIIEDVITITPNITIKEAKDTMHKHNVSGLPVINNEDEVVGILTKRDVRFAPDSVMVSEAMSKDLIFASSDISNDAAKQMLYQNRIEKLLILDKDKKLEGLVTVKDMERRGAYPNSTRDENGKLVIGAAIGPFDEKRALALDPYVDFILVDLAHGHNMNAMRSAANISKKIGSELIYGSLGSQEGAKDVAALIEDVAGLRVGIGSGAICSTSVVTKASSPTLYSTLQVSTALHEMGLDIPVIADGGIKGSGDAALAFAAGASAVMMGSLFAGCRESPGTLLPIQGKMMKSYRGMGSRAAMAARYAQDRYNQPTKKIAEGVEGYVPYRGFVQDVVEEFTSGLKAAFGYAGAGSINEMWANGKLGKISSVGLREAQPHDILSTNFREDYSLN